VTLLPACGVQKKSGKNYADGLVELKADGQCCLYDMVGLGRGRGGIRRALKQSVL
jgi:hypothetical protein